VVEDSMLSLRVGYSTVIGRNHIYLFGRETTAAF